MITSESDAFPDAKAEVKPDAFSGAFSGAFPDDYYKLKEKLKLVYEVYPILKYQFISLKTSLGVKNKEKVALKRKFSLRMLIFLAILVKSSRPYMPKLQHRATLSQITVKQH